MGFRPPMGEKALDQGGVSHEGNGLYAVWEALSAQAVEAAAVRRLSRGAEEGSGKAGTRGVLLGDGLLPL